MTGTNGPNTSGIHPKEYKVLVRPKELEAKTKGGLILADETLEKEGFARQEGILVAISPLAFQDMDYPEGEAPKIGDRVMFAKYNADTVKGNDGGDYWMMNDRAIMATVEAVG